LARLRVTYSIHRDRGDPVRAAPPARPRELGNSATRPGTAHRRRPRYG